MRSRILLVDTNALLHAVKFAFGSGRISDRDKDVFVIYGFLFRLNALIRKTKAQVVVYALDSKTSLRKQIYSEYKEARKNNKTDQQKRLDELAYPQFKEITDYVLPTIGFSNLFGADGFEADDVVARICKSYPEDQIIICSTDHDLYQLLTPNVCIINPDAKKFYTIDNFIDEYEIEPKMWKRVKAIGGCNSDGVKGVPIPQPDPTKKQRHVAEKGALNYILGKTKPTSNAYKAITSKKGKSIINRNKSLVILPFKGTPEYVIRPDRLRKKGLKRVCQRYGFKTILEDINTWQKSMNLR